MRASDRVPATPRTAADEIAEAVEALIDLAQARHYDAHADETFTECRVCGEWEGHTDACPIPPLQRWQEKGPTR